MNTRELPPLAARRLSDAPVGKRIVLIYAGIVTGLAVLTTLITFLLDLQINKSGGLSGMGTRTILSAVQSTLPLIQSAVIMCLTLGYRAAMLRIAREQYVSPQTLRLGFSRFWVLLRSGILQALILLSIGIASMYLSTTLFVLSPWSGPLVEVMTPIMTGMSSLSPNLVLDDATAAQLLSAMVPLVLISLVVFTLAAIPILLRYLMVDYVIIDKPGIGAMAALRESRTMMRSNCLKLLGLGFRMWWYYLALAATSLLCYGDSLLPLLGVTLPVSETTAFYGFYVLYLAAQFAITYFLGNRVEVAYALAYESIRPRETPPDGVVLGNIFNM